MANPEHNELSGNSATRVNPKDFELKDMPTELQGLTSQILFDMYDQIIKWGHPYGETGKAIHVYNILLKWGLHLSASPLTKRMSIIKTYGNGIVETTEGVIPLKPKVGLVLWDRRLTVEQAKEALNANDAIFEDKGYIKENGERLHKGHNN